MRHGIAILGDLDLENVKIFMGKGHFRPRQIKFPHAEEAFVIKRYRFCPARHETLAPVAKRMGVMHGQDFDILHQQPRFFDGRQHLGKRGNITAGENIFFDEGVGRQRRIGLADGMQHHHALVVQHLRHLVEIIAIMGRPDMFEHADGDDAIVFFRSRQVAIVLQFEPDICRKAPFGGAVAGNAQLFFAERNAGYIRTGAFGNIHRHAAPAGADFQHALARLGHQLGGYVPFFRDLRFIETDAGRIEIGAGILPVLIEEKIEQLGAQIVMMSDVALVVVDRQMHLDAGGDDAGHAAPNHAEGQRLAQRIAFDQRQKIVDVAFRDLRPAFHIHFSQLQRRIGGDLLHGGFVGEVQNHLFSRAVAECAAAARAVDGEITGLDYLFEKNMQRRRHGTPNC